MNWDHCIVCQKNTNESLQCPANSKRKDTGAGYSSFINDVKEFQKIGVVVSLKIDCQEEDEKIKEVLTENKASWHKSCRDSYNKTKLHRAKKRQLREVEENREDYSGNMDFELTTSPIKLRRSSSLSFIPQKQCFFCGETDNVKNLHSPEHLEVDEKVRECAILLNDNKLIAKLSAGDLIAIEAKYHAKCLVGLYNRARPFRNQQMTKSAEETPEQIDLEELAFAELISYIEEYIENENIAILKLSDLLRFYTLKLEELEVVTNKVHATRLKDKILETFPHLTAHCEGREVQLISKHDIGGILTNAKSSTSDAWCLARAAQLVRRDILKARNSFNGTFSSDCQVAAVPKSLLTLIGMIAKGSTTKINPADNQACLSIAQLIVFNSISRSRDSSGPARSTHHVRFRECPLPIYTALKIHGASRDRSLIDTFYSLGLSISYDRFLSISTEVTNSVVDRYEKEGVVCPSKLEKDLFTTGQLDNIDHNTSATSAQSSFHGTAISLIQNCPDDLQNKTKESQTIYSTKPLSSKTVSQLPSSYTDIPPVALSTNDFYAPKTNCQFLTSQQEPCEILEEDWLNQSQELILQGKLKQNDFVSWAAFRASKTRKQPFRPAIISLLPMFLDNAHSAATIAHGMNVVKAAVKHLNPTQTPVIALDQPLFALGKEIQWKLTDYNENNFVLMLGGLHIEMAAFKMLGKWLTGSGWPEVMCNAGVATQGVAESFLSASHIARTKRAHQVYSYQ